MTRSLATQIVFALVLASAAPALAQTQTLSLQQAVSEARGHSPVLQQRDAAAEEASWLPVEAISGHVPKIGVSASHFFNTKFQFIHLPAGAFGPNPISFPGIYPYTTLSFDLSWNVFDGLGTWNRYFGARHASRAAELERSRAMFQLDQDVTLRFYQALAAQQLLGVAEQNLKTLQDHLEKAQAQLKQGEATRFDILRIQVQLADALPQRTQAEDNVVLARRNLAEAMGLETDDRPLSGTLLVPDEKLVPATTRFEPSQREDLQALDERAQAAWKAHSASLSSWIPRAGLMGQYQVYNNIDHDLSGSNYFSAYNIGVGLSWDLFDLGNIAKQKESGARAVQAEAAETAANLKARDDFELWKRRYFYDVSLYRARREAIGAADESVRLARLGFSAGTRTSTDVLDAELDLFRARAGVIHAQLDAAQSLLNLELSMGHRTGATPETGAIQ